MEKNLILLSTKDYGSFYKVELMIKDENKSKIYEYSLDSGYAFRQFKYYYDMGCGCHGKALSILNKFGVNRDEITGSEG